MPWVEKALYPPPLFFGDADFIPPHLGNAITDILFGHVSPSGRLPITFPKRLEDTPAFLNYGKSDRHIVYGEGVFIGYRYYEKLKTAPLFHFGYGLSYTQFDYSNLVVPTTFAAEPDHILKLSVDVTNTGSVAGAETVQIYISDVKSSMQRPRKELKAFDKASLDPSETKTVTLEVDKSALAFWCELDDKWKAEAGTFKVIVGRSAALEDEVLEADFELSGTMTWSGF
jgi:beta-glucosidase